MSADLDHTQATVPARYWHRLDDGRIQCDSAVGVGTTFTVDLPLPESRDPARSTPGDGPLTLTGIRVLVAEDNAVNQLVIERLLRRMGVEAVVVPDGNVAVEINTISSSLTYCFSHCAT